jgi:hypothetical protein
MTSKLRVLQLVDSIEYVTTNCYQHQLLSALEEVVDVRLVSLAELGNTSMPQGYDRIVCCLKQRSISAHRMNLRSYLSGASYVMYDQDPWGAYNVSTPYPGLYDWLIENTNLKTIAVTTKWWADYLSSKGISATFVKMSVLPKYCDSSVKYEQRTHELGFVGTVHPHRRALFNDMQKFGMQTYIMHGNNRDYAAYLSSLRGIKIFVRSENNPIKLLDGTETNVGHGIWIRDIEVAAQGCWSLREKFSDKDMQLYVSNIPTVKTYDNVEELHGIVKDITSMDPIERQSIIDASVKQIKDSNVWIETARTLLEMT